MNAFTIKLIAIISMIIDHAGAVFELDISFRIIGRLAFPLFVYLIAEGCRHTRSMEKYLLRLGAFALLSEIPFDLATGRDIDFFNNTNIFYTLWLGVLCVYAFRHSKVLGVLVVLAVAGAADWLGSDYGMVGVLFIFLTALCGERKWLQMGVIAGAMVWLYLPMPGWWFLAAGLAAVPVVGLASGEQGPAVKWLFYWLYPGHLLLFALISKIWYSV